MVLIVLLASCGNQGTPLSNETVAVSPTSLPTSIFIPVTVTPSPLPTLPIINMITPASIQMDSWKEYEVALAKSLLSFLPPEEVLCEWEILGRSEQEVYVWATCDAREGGHGAASSAVIHLNPDGTIQSVEKPGSGSKRNSNILKLFPPDIQEIILNNLLNYRHLSEHLEWRREHPEEPPLVVLSAILTHDKQEVYSIFSPIPSNSDILATQPEGTLAGYGILYNEDQPWGDHGDGKYEFNSQTWQEATYDSIIWARGGKVLTSPTQGAIRVIIAPHSLNSSYQNDIIVESPIQAGALNIIGAAGERLILKSEQGQTFYFDVPSLQFVASLDTVIPAATPPPTETLLPQLSPTDDAPNEPLYVHDTKLEENDLNYYINSPSDYDWLHFVSQANGTLKVSLVPRGKNYGLRVVFVDENDNGAIVGEDTSNGGGRKQIVIPNATSGNYMVRVWSLDGTYDENQPYTVRFEPHKPEKIIPILECVSENSDGTFTAHFGFDNPNPKTIMIDANHDNAFHPGPVFRTGQPEYFVPGRVTDWFSVLFDGNGLTWTLDGGAVTANRNSPRCP